MALRAGLLNGNNINQDYDFGYLLQAIATGGYVEGLEVTSGLVGAGKGFVPCERTNGNKPFVFVELTDDYVIDTTGTKKVWIEIPQAIIDDGALNPEDGTGTAEIKTGASYPAKNYIALASITGGTITDERVKVTVKADSFLFSKGLRDLLDVYNFTTPTTRKYLVFDLAEQKWTTGDIESGDIPSMTALSNEDFMAGEDILRGKLIFLEGMGNYIYTALEESIYSGLTNYGSTTTEYGMKFLANKTVAIVNVTKYSSVNATRARIKTSAGTVLETASFTGDVATFGGGTILNSGDYFRVEIDNSGASYSSYYATSNYALSNVSVVTGSQNGNDFGSLMNVLKLKTAETLPMLNVGDVSANTRKSFRMFGTGEEITGFDVLVGRVGSPSLSYQFRVETDSAGSSSGSLFHADGVGAFLNSEITTAPQHLRLSLAGGITIPKGQIVRLTIYQGTPNYGVEIVNASNYYTFGYFNEHSTTRYDKSWNGSVWSATTNKMGYIKNSTLYGYDIELATYSSKNISVSGNPVSVVFSPTGLKMIVLKSGYLYGYNLSTARDVTTATVDGLSFNMGTQDSTIYGFYMSTDGLRVYATGQTNKKIYQYTLGTARTLNTMSYASKFVLVTSADTAPVGIWLNSTGTKAYMVGYTNDKIYSYTLATARDISTATYDSKFFLLSSQDSTPCGVVFRPDGLAFFVLGQSTNYIYEYSLSTARDVTTASYSSNRISSSSTSFGFFIREDGMRMGIALNSSNYVYQYSMPFSFVSNGVQPFEEFLYSKASASYSYKMPSIVKFTVDDYITSDIVKYDFLGLTKTITSVLKGTEYFVSNTAGEISSTAGTRSFSVGTAQIDGELLIAESQNIIKAGASLTGGTVYLAGQNLFVVAYITKSNSGGTNEFRGYVGTNSNPTTIIADALATNAMGTFSMMFPVLKGQYFKVIGTGDYTTLTSAKTFILG